MQDYIDELNEDSERIIKRVNTSMHDLVLVGQEIERFEILEFFRSLIVQKELEGDNIAAEVLGWAYDKISDMNID